MKLIVENSANECLNNIFYYNLRYSIRNAIDTDINLKDYIHDLEYFPYLGRYIPEIGDERFRELIYRRNRRSGYRIMYYISEKKNIIYIISVINCKQDFNKFLKLHNYFQNYYNL